MKNLTNFINESISKQKIKTTVDEIIKTANVDPNKDIYMLTRNKDAMYVYKTTNKEELIELYTNTLENHDEYGRYVSLHKDKIECIEIHRKYPFRKLELYDKTEE